jgi:hypothetical protein
MIALQALPEISSPPIVPDISQRFALSQEQCRFMWLHYRHLIVKWKQILGSSQIRAWTNEGLTATISAAGLEHLITFGLMERCFGFGVRLTEAGKELAR